MQQDYMLRYLDWEGIQEQRFIPMRVHMKDKSRHKNSSRPKLDDVEMCWAKYIYHWGTIDFSTYTRHDIPFIVNLLARLSYAPTHCHWNDVKHLNGSIDLRLFYPYNIRECFHLRSFSHRRHREPLAPTYAAVLLATSVAWRPRSDAIDSSMSFSDRPLIQRLPTMS